MANKFDTLILKNQLCFPIYLCSKEIIRKYSPLLDKLNLTYTQYIVMMYFWENKKSNVKELGKTLLLDSSTLTPLLKKLEKKGYLNRVRSSIDERNLEVTITEKGEKIKEKALNIPQEIKKCVNLTDEEGKTLYKILNKVLNSVGGENNGNN